MQPDVIGAKYFRIANLNTDFYGPKGASAVARDLKTLAREVERLQAKYAIGSKDSWQKWLTGIMVYYTDREPSDVLNDVRKSKEKFKKRIQRENAKLRKKRK